LQQAWLRAAERVGQVRDPDRAEAWFYRVLRRAIADFRVQRAREVKQLEQLVADVDAQEPEEVAACACALGLLGGERAEYRELIERVDLNDERVVDVAAALGLTANNTTVRLHRARRSLRDAVLAHCGASPECGDCECD
jgi:RNA polymerase sigma-70 factor (ECF subfamily)